MLRRVLFAWMMAVLLVAAPLWGSVAHAAPHLEQQHLAPHFDMTPSAGLNQHATADCCIDGDAGNGAECAHAPSCMTHHCVAQMVQVGIQAAPRAAPAVAIPVAAAKAVSSDPDPFPPRSATRV